MPLIIPVSFIAKDTPRPHDAATVLQPLLLWSSPWVVS